MQLAQSGINFVSNMARSVAMRRKTGDMKHAGSMKEELGKEDEPKVQKIIGKLKKASDAHAGQAKDLEKAVKEAVTQDDHGEKINQDKKDAAMKKTDQKKDFKSLRAETKIIKLGDKGKTATGKEAGAIDVEPSAKPI